jgi:hypothetical protein
MALRAILGLTELFAAGVNNMPEGHHHDTPRYTKHQHSPGNVGGLKLTVDLVTWWDIYSFSSVMLRLSFCSFTSISLL